MKAIIPVLLMILISIGTQSQTTSLNNEVTANGRSYLYGTINRTGLKQGIYKNWFEKGYDSFKPNGKKLAAVDKGSLENVTVKLLMATWCPDSKRNVPKFYKIMDALGIEEKNLMVWSLDFRKRGPNNEQTTYGVYRVPTIIFYREGKEMGRFVERLKTGQNLEDIFIDILKSIPG